MLHRGIWTGGGLPHSGSWKHQTNPTYGLPSAKVTNTICASCSKLFPLSLYFHDFSESRSYKAMPTATPPIVTRSGLLCPMLTPF